MKKILLILLLFTIITGCRNKNLEDNIVDNNEQKVESNIIYQNSNTGVVKQQEVEGLVFDNVILNINDSMSFFTVNVTNINEVMVELKYIKIFAYDENNNLLFDFCSYVGDYIDSNQTLRLSSNVEGDLTKVKSVKYEIIK